MMQRPNPVDRAPRLRLAQPIPLEEVELIEQVRAGHTEAYGELVRQYQDRVFNTCWRICGNLEDARDLTQEAFLKAFEQFDKFRGHSSVYTWIYRIAVNLCLSERRRSRGSRRTTSLDQLRETGGQAAALVEQAGVNRGEPANDASRVELQQRLLDGLGQLDEDHRAVLVLRDMEGFEYREIADMMEIPIGTVRSRLHRARMTLRDIVQSLQ